MIGDTGLTAAGEVGRARIGDVTVFGRSADQKYKQKRHYQVAPCAASAEGSSEARMGTIARSANIRNGQAETSVGGGEVSGYQARGRCLSHLLYYVISYFYQKFVDIFISPHLYIWTTQICHNARRRRDTSNIAASRSASCSTTIMPLQKAPEKRPSAENMKQKSLINFFSKSAPKQTGASTPAPKSRPQLAAGSLSSDLESSPKDTPPTSDPIDVDMLSDEQPVKAPTRPKDVSSLNSSHCNASVSLPHLRRVASVRLLSQTRTMNKRKMRPAPPNLLRTAPLPLSITTSHPPLEVRVSSHLAESVPDGVYISRSNQETAHVSTFL